MRVKKMQNEKEARGVRHIRRLGGLARAQENGGQDDGEDSRWSGQSGSCPSPVERGGPPECQPRRAAVFMTRSSSWPAVRDRSAVTPPSVNEPGLAAPCLARERHTGWADRGPRTGSAHPGTRARVSRDVPEVPAGTNLILPKGYDVRVPRILCGAPFYTSGNAGSDGRGERRSGASANDLHRKRPDVLPSIDVGSRNVITDARRTLPW
ncbi:hypothetical protein HPB52_004418 [Rhipicephalus sanguineus]|uniref:Uncharacterized protein n=1 Tax=Rhipicephalus sanguineus TaxID=34632 RepID=A0A9D4PHT2_RHISA|nr:hypothetical protein HPB52_004418 [Rhipicephalus sanguineus]